MDAILKDAVRMVVRLLVAGDFGRLEQRTRGRRLTEEEIRTVIQEYPATFIMPPAETFDDPDAVEIENPPPGRYYVRVDLWSKEEGRSDLSLELIVGKLNGQPDIEITNIHVL